MPHLDGFEESRRIRAMEQERGLPPQVHSTQVHHL
jgi:CheY-like chemotaxis protein